MTNYIIARENNKVTEYYSFPGTFQPEMKKCISFKLPPVLHALNVIQSGFPDIFVIKDNGIDQEIVKV